MIAKINVGELRRLVKESQGEFKPLVFGSDESKKINDKAYSDIKKETSSYDGGLQNKANDKKPFEDSQGKGMHDLEYDSISEPFKDKVKSQMKGYVSRDNETKHKGDEFGNADFDDKGKIYDGAKEHAERAKASKDKAAEIGLTARELNKKDIEKQNSTMFESKKIKRLNFKREFLSEGHMMSRIPDDYKVEGNKFIMRDCADNEYLVEWHKEEPKVTKKVNMKLVNEEKDRIRSLWGYKSPKSETTTSSFRLKEGNDFSDMVNKARKLIK